MSRVLVERIPCLARFNNWVTWHIPHEYSDVKSKGTVLVGLFDFYVRLIYNAKVFNHN